MNPEHREELLLFPVIFRNELKIQPNKADNEQRDIFRQTTLVPLDLLSPELRILTACSQDTSQARITHVVTLVTVAADESICFLGN